MRNELLKDWKLVSIPEVIGESRIFVAVTNSEVTVNQQLKALTPKDVLPDYITIMFKLTTMKLEKLAVKMEQPLRALKLHC